MYYKSINGKSKPNFQLCGYEEDNPLPLSHYPLKTTLALSAVVFGFGAILRASIYIYNNGDDIESGIDNNNNNNINNNIIRERARHGIRDVIRRFAS